MNYTTSNTLAAKGVRAFGAAFFLSSMAFAGYVMAGHAANASETKQVTRTVTVYTLADSPKLSETVMAICADKSVRLSDKARKACDDKAFPPLTKALTFRNSGIGGEFNSLVRQREPVNSPATPAVAAKTE